MNDRVFSVDLQSGYNDLLHVGLSQYDVGVVLEFDVFDGGAAAVFPSGTTAKIQGVRPSGVGFDISCTLSGNIVTVATVTDMTGEAGSFPVEIRFTASGVDVGTVNFVFQIEKAAHPDGTIDADITHEQDIIDKINQILIQTTPDATLSEAGVAADSKTVGDNIRRIDGQIGTLGTRITNVEDDISYQSQRIDRTNKIKAPVIWEEASGNPAVFDDGANMYIKDLTLTLTPSQDLNGYDYAWAGGNGKNLLPTIPSQTVGGLTLQSNSDGSFNLNGTTTNTSPTVSILSPTRFVLDAGQYYLSGTPDGTEAVLRVSSFATGTAVTIRSGNGAFTLTEAAECEIRIYRPATYTVNNLTYYPMIRRLTETDAYAPYENICPISGAESVTVKRTGKNLLDTTGRTGGMTSGVTIVRNDDGSFTLNGTCTGANNYAIRPNAVSHWGGMILSGCPAGGASNAKYSMRIINNDLGQTLFDTGEGVTIPESWDGAVVRVLISIYNGYTYNGLTFYPMIRPTSISDDTYEPYSGIDTNIDFGQTIYGGTVNPILWNLQGGDIVFDRKVFSVGDLTWTKQSGNIFKATPDNVTGSASYDLSDTFRRNPVADSAMQNGDFKLTVAGSLYVKMEGFGTAAGFKAAYADAKFCAKLAHSEIGSMYTNCREITTAYLDNVITAQPDKGNVTNIKVTYPADTKAYIDKAIAAISG